MGKKKRRFIDKKNAQSYRLIHKTHGVGDDDEETYQQEAGLEAGLSASFAGASAASQSTDEHKRLEEQRKFGVYFDDGYNYLQHLRDPAKEELVLDPLRRKHGGDENVDIIHIPAASAGAVEEDDEDLLGQQQPRYQSGLPHSKPDPEMDDVDADVMECLEEGFTGFIDPENVDDFEDDFILQANGGEAVHKLDDDEMEEGEEEDDEDDWEDVDTDEEDDNEDDEGESREEAVAAGSCSRHFAPRGNPQDDAYHRMMLGLDDDEPDRRPRFNDYAMTSANTNRSEGLQLLDARFEKFMERWDEEDEMAQLQGHNGIDDGEEVHPFLAERMQRMAEEYMEERTNQPTLEALMAADDTTQSTEYQKTMAAIADRYRFEKSDDEQEEEVEMMTLPMKAAFDVESIRSVSTQSSRRHMPAIIRLPSKPKKHSASTSEDAVAPVAAPSKIVLDKKTGFPTGVLHEKPKKPDSGSEDEAPEAVLVRHKDESREDRKLRKKAIKESQRERRAEKKANKIAYQTEQKRQAVQSARSVATGLAM